MGNQFDVYEDSEGNNHIISNKNDIYNDSLMGDNLSDFAVLKTLNSYEGNNDISKVRSLKNDKIYAMKKIELNKIGNNQERQLCFQEMEKLKALKHPHLLRYYKTFQDNNDLYMIFEYMNNSDLNSFISAHQKLGKKIKEEEIWNFILQCLSGLEYLHRENLAYLAIRPCNIFLNNEQKLKIGLLYDTPKLADKYYDINKDIHFIGLYFYKMCFSHYNFVENSKWINDFQIIKNIVNDTYSKDLIDIIFKMIEDDPKKKQSSAQLYKLVKDKYVQRYTNNTSIEAVLRCLYSYPDFTNIIKKEEKYYENNKNKFHITYWYLKTIKQFSQNNNLNDCFEEFRRAVASENPKLDTSKEINPIYLFSFLLEKMHKEGNKKIKTQINNNQNNQYIINSIYNVEEEDKTNKEQVFNKFSFYLKSNINSNISNNFFGILKTKRNCKVCRNGIYSFNSFFIVPFDLTKFMNLQYFDLLNNGFHNQHHNGIFLDKNKYHIFCDRCLTEQDHTEFNSYYSINNHLTIYFYRGVNYQINLNINFPEKLDINNYVEDIQMRPNFYLVGSLNRVVENGKENYVFFTRDSNNFQMWKTSFGVNIFNNAPIDIIQNSGQIIMLFYNRIK